MGDSPAQSGIAVVGTDSTTQMRLPTTSQGVQGASGATVITAHGTLKNRVFLLSISVDTAGLVTIGDTTLKVYLPANGSYTWDLGTVGLEQNTAATAITITNAGGGNVTGYALFRAG